MDADTSVNVFSKAMEAPMLQTARMVEEQLDAEIQKLDQMDEEELELVKRRRLEALKKAQQQKQVTDKYKGPNPFSCIAFIILEYLYKLGHS